MSKALYTCPMDMACPLHQQCQACKLRSQKRANFVQKLKQTPEYKRMKAAEANMCPTNVRCQTPEVTAYTRKRPWERQACIWRRRLRQYRQKDEMQKKEATEEQVLCFIS